jgi:hypothetical protein
MTDETLKAGKYELQAHYNQQTSKQGQPFEYEAHKPGAIVELTAEEANRLRDVIAKPGEAARREADRHRAEAERLQALADAAEARAKGEESAAKEATKDAKAS